jgi:hypothetical protein
MRSVVVPLPTKLYLGVNIRGERERGREREERNVYEEAGRSRGEKGWSVGAEEGRSRGEEKDAVRERERGLRPRQESQVTI